jgi:hypothetical protein
LCSECCVYMCILCHQLQLASGFHFWLWQDLSQPYSTLGLTQLLLAVANLLFGKEKSGHPNRSRCGRIFGCKPF